MITNLNELMSLQLPQLISLLTFLIPCSYSISGSYWEKNNGVSPIPPYPLCAQSPGRAWASPWKPACRLQFRSFLILQTHPESSACAFWNTVAFGDCIWIPVCPSCLSSPGKTLMGGVWPQSRALGMMRAPGHTAHEGRLRELPLVSTKQKRLRSGLDWWLQLPTGTL